MPNVKCIFIDLTGFYDTINYPKIIFMPSDDNTETGRRETVLIVNDDETAVEAIRGILQADLGIHDKDIKTANSSTEAVETIRAARGEIRLLIIQEKTSGRQFKDHIKEEFFKDRPIPPMVTNDQMPGSSDTSSEFVAAGSSAFSKIQAILRQKSEFLKGILSALNVLVVSEIEENRNRIKELLMKEGVPSENIFLAKNPDAGLVKIVDGVNREVHSGGGKTEKREDVHTVIIDDKAGPSFLQRVQEDARGVHPFAVVLREDGAEISTLWQKAELHSREMQFMQRSEFNGDAVGDVAIQSNLQSREQLLKEAQNKGGGKDDKAGAPSGADSSGSRQSVVTLGDTEQYFCFYEEARKLPTLVRRSDFDPNMAINTNHISGENVGSFDMDGTLIDPYVMGRFVQFLSRDNNLQGLIKDLPPQGKRIKRQLLTKLINIIEFITKSHEDKAAARGKIANQYRERPYEEILDLLNNSYAELLAGLKVHEVCKKGHQFSLADFEQHKVKTPYAKPLIDMVRYLGITPTLLTGMPAEVMGGYRERLGIKERCYPLEIRVNGNVFDNQVIFKGGTAEEKQRVASSIVASGNQLFFHAGDQISDIGVMTVAMESLEKSCRAQGKGFFMFSPNSREGHDLIEKIYGGHSGIYLAGRMALIDRKLKTFAVLERVLDELMGIVSIRDERNSVPPESFDITRRNIETLSRSRFTELQKFYK
jgi:phosphoserine phosphatase/CheY-like chemotaxis protein